MREKRGKKRKPDEKVEKEQIKDVKEEVTREEANNVRKLSNLLQPYIQWTKGLYYGCLHLFIMMTYATILLFNNNIYHLLISLNIVILDALCCVFVHDCPLTILEKKYLGRSLISTRMVVLEKMGILYQCDHIYEITLEFLTNIGTLIVGKIGILIILHMIDIRLNQSK
jgi:hypothetical protein